jgi:hypothetical protein
VIRFNVGCSLPGKAGKTKDALTAKKDNNNYDHRVFNTFLSDDQIEKIIEDLNFFFVQCDNLPQCKDKIKFHDCLQSRSANLAKKYNLTGVSEFRVKDRGDGRSGSIDVAWLLGRKTIVLIEIDSSFREKSIFKLKNNDAELKIWIYYGSIKEKYERPEKYDNIFGIELIRRWRV